MTLKTMEDDVLKKMEDALKTNEMEDNLNIFFNIKDDLNFLILEDDLNFLKMEDDLKKCNFNQQHSAAQTT